MIWIQAADIPRENVPVIHGTRLPGLEPWPMIWIQAADIPRENVPVIHGTRFDLIEASRTGKINRF
jgi:hypothetical protein